MADIFSYVPGSPFLTTSVSDVFSRPNEYPLRGPLWVNANTGTIQYGLNLVDNEVWGNTYPNECGAIRGNRFAPDQSVKFLVGTDGGTASWYGAAVLRSDPAKAINYAVMFVWWDNNPVGDAYIETIEPYSRPTLFSVPSIARPVLGDEVLFSVVGSLYNAWVNGVLVASHQTDFRAGGNPGIIVGASASIMEFHATGEEYDPSLVSVTDAIFQVQYMFVPEHMREIAEPISVSDYVVGSAGLPSHARGLPEAIGISDSSDSRVASQVFSVSHYKTIADGVGVRDSVGYHHPKNWIYCAAGSEIWKVDWTFGNSPVMVTSVTQLNSFQAWGIITAICRGRGTDGWGDPQKDFIFAVDQSQKNLLKLSKDNFSVVAVGTPPTECIYGYGSWTQAVHRGIQIDHDGPHLVVTDQLNGRILMFQSDHLAYVGGIPAGMWAMEGPTGIAYNPNNDMWYVCDYGVQSPAGGKIMMFEKALKDKFTGEANPAFFSWKGNYINVGTGDGQLYNPWRIWFDKNFGNLYIVDQGGVNAGYRLQKFAYPSFEFVQGRGLGPGVWMGWDPSNICIDDDYLYLHQWEAGSTYGSYIERTALGNIDWSHGFPEIPDDYVRPSVKPYRTAIAGDTGRPLRYCNELPIPMVAGSGPPGLFYERGSPAYLFDFLTTTPFYLTDNERPIVREGISYVPAPVKRGRNRKSQASPAEDLTLSVQNVDRKAAKALLDPGLIAARVNVYKCYWTSPISHTPPALVYEGIVNTNRAEDNEKTADVAVELKSDFWNWNLPVPKNQFAGNCQWIFKSSTPGCQYVSHYDTNPSSTIVASLCDRTWENCGVLKNERRFRGFRNIEPLERTIWWGRSRSW